MSKNNIINKKSKFKSLLTFIKKETVLSIASALALSTMLMIPPSKSYWEYIDFKVLACLFCLMAVVSGFRKTGLFEIAASAMIKFFDTLQKMSFFLIFTTFFLSMAITNDVALITFIPFSLLLLKDLADDKIKFKIITLQTIAANLGSSLTPVGNPQNLYLFTYYQMNAKDFFLAILPIVGFGAILLSLVILTIKNEKIITSVSRPNYMSLNCKVLFYMILFIISVLSVFQVIEYKAAILIVFITIFILDKKLFKQIDYSLLFTFIGFFIFIGNFQKIEAVHKFLTLFVKTDVLIVSVFTSQFISNVPAAILLSKFTKDAASLLQGVSLGGLGTIIASLASVISYKFLVHEYPGKSFQYLKIFTFWNFLFLAVLLGFSLLIG